MKRYVEVEEEYEDKKGTLIWIVMAIVGIALLIIGIVLQYTQSKKFKEASTKQRKAVPLDDKGQPMKKPWIGMVLAVVGGASLAFGLLYKFKAPKETVPDRQPAKVSKMGSGAKLSFGGKLSSMIGKLPKIPKISFKRNKKPGRKSKTRILAPKRRWTGTGRNRALIKGGTKFPWFAKTAKRKVFYEIEDIEDGEYIVPHEMTGRMLEDSDEFEIIDIDEDEFEDLFDEDQYLIPSLISYAWGKSSGKKSALQKLNPVSNVTSNVWNIVTLVVVLVLLAIGAYVAYILFLKPKMDAANDPKNQKMALAAAQTAAGIPPVQALSG